MTVATSLSAKATLFSMTLKATVEGNCSIETAYSLVRSDDDWNIAYSEPTSQLKCHALRDREHSHTPKEKPLTLVPSCVVAGSN